MRAAAWVAAAASPEEATGEPCSGLLKCTANTHTGHCSVSQVPDAPAFLRAPWLRWRHRGVPGAGLPCPTTLWLRPAAALLPAPGPDGRWPDGRRLDGRWPDGALSGRGGKLWRWKRRRHGLSAAGLQRWICAATSAARAATTTTATPRRELTLGLSLAWIEEAR